MTEPADTPRVLVVDDEREVADTYALRLRGEVEAETAYSGLEALEQVDEEVDVVLLDRRMPEVTGDEVLEEIRERELPCRVIMLTAIDPGFDTLEMPFDDYLCKPVPKDDLVAAVRQQLEIVEYERLSEFFSLAAKEAVLSASTEVTDPREEPEYERLLERVEEMRGDLKTRIEDFGELERAFLDVNREPG